MGDHDTEIGLILVPAFGERGSFTPLGLAYLNGALRDAGHTPAFHDLNTRVRQEDPDLHGALIAHGFSPDVGGFFGPDIPLILQLGAPETCPPDETATRILNRVASDISTLPTMQLALLTLWDSNVYYALAMGRALRARGVQVVMGGPSVRLTPLRTLLLRLGAADLMMVGEGETRVVEVARRVLAGASLEGIAGTATWTHSGGIQETPIPADLRIHDLVRPTFEGMPTDNILPILTSRGCIRDCSFCTERFNWKRFRQRHVDDVLDEIEALMTTHNCRDLEFNDDLVNGHPRWLERFLDALIARRWDLRWSCFMEPYRLSPALIDKSAAAGCQLIKFGVQHFDPQMLRIIGRGEEVSEVVDVLHRSADAGIRVSFDIIPGHPGETEAAHDINLRTLPEVLDGRDRLEVNINPFLLLYGSRVHQDPERYGVSIQTWDASMLPGTLRPDLGDLMSEFIRSYTQTPTRALVVERTRQLEDLAQRAITHRAIASIPIGSDVPLTQIKRRGLKQVTLRPGNQTTSRELLAAIRNARQSGCSFVGVETPGAPLDKTAFVSHAAMAGMSHAILVPGPDPDSRRSAAQMLTHKAIPFIYFDTPSNTLLETLRQTVEEAVSLRAPLVILSLSEAMASSTSAPMTEVAAAADQAIALGASSSCHVLIHGLPFCLLPERPSHLLPSLPLVFMDGQGTHRHPARMMQRPRCRACVLSTDCPGAPESALNRDGDDCLRPAPGRPVETPWATPLEGFLSGD